MLNLFNPDGTLRTLDEVCREAIKHAVAVSGSQAKAARALRISPKKVMRDLRRDKDKAK